MNAKDAIRGTMDLSHHVLKAYFDDLSDAELMLRPGPGCNVLAWQLGHLISSEVSLLNQVCPGAAPELPAGFAEQHSKATASSDDASKFGKKQQYLDLLGHVLEHVAIELQNMAGEEVTFGKTRSAGPPGVYTVIYEYAQRDEGIAAGELGLKLLCSLLPAAIRPADSVPADWSWEAARDEFIRYAHLSLRCPLAHRRMAQLPQLSDHRLLHLICRLQRTFGRVN